MDAFTARHPYRCLPLSMANTTGWEILCPFGFEAEWDGGPGAEAIRFRPDPDATLFDHFAASHFTHGVITFHTGWLFRTPPGWALRASGSPNRFKHGLSPLEGLVETDWLPYPFTMNWAFTAPGKVRFEKGEPFCFIQPVEHRRIEAFEPVRVAMDDDADLARQYETWKETRTPPCSSISRRRTSPTASSPSTPAGCSAPRQAGRSGPLAVRTGSNTACRRWRVWSKPTGCPTPSR